MFFLISVALKIKLSEILPLFKDSSNCEVFFEPPQEKSIPELKIITLIIFLNLFFLFFYFILLY